MTARWEKGPKHGCSVNKSIEMRGRKTDNRRRRRWDTNSIREETDYERTGLRGFCSVPKMSC